MAAASVELSSNSAAAAAQLSVKPHPRHVSSTRRHRCWAAAVVGGAALLRPTASSSSSAGAKVSENDGYHPILSVFAVTGIFPSRRTLTVPFEPLFRRRLRKDNNYRCWLEYAMDRFSLSVDTRAPAIVSRLTRDGKAVRSRSSLSTIHLGPGEKTIFSVDVTDRVTMTYTLIVERRLGSSLELQVLRPLTGSLGVPYNPGELQGLFHVDQSIGEDFVEIEYVKADGGQHVSCHVDSAETIGDDAPTTGDLATHPNLFSPSLEQLNNYSVTEEYTAEHGAVARCRGPVDTWRRVAIVLEIASADGKANRRVRLLVTRKGCARDTFYFQGRCREWCPPTYYEQHFNWRCGSCNTRCQFCDHWARCTRCIPDERPLRYRMTDDGTCEAVRVHAYRMYYDLSRYLAMGCGALLSLYVLVGLSWGCYKICRRSRSEDSDEEEPTLHTSSDYNPFPAKARADGGDEKLQRPCGGARGNVSGFATVGRGRGGFAAAGGHGGFAAAAARMLTPREHPSRTVWAAK
eukprot:TRINITY_DN74366_c0_g1_i1.p1 TRINITY_DN74366_c0_g1~~TRINITY_DN74366_c0_g1_i1.p1  ORF type:complete len:539 (+),score=71.44 TRINITY_DN74366_c0_g1_i1:65-1618(+)